MLNKMIKYVVKSFSIQANNPQKIKNYKYFFYPRSYPIDQYKELFLFTLQPKEI